MVQSLIGTKEGPMAQPKTLTEAQIAVLRWVGDGCPDDVYEGVHHRISAASLNGRGLITVTGRGPSWSAEITDAGAEYLAKVDGPTPPVPRQANRSVTVQMIDDVIAAGGVMQIPRDPGRGGVDWQQRVRQAIRHNKVPSGKRLLYESDWRAGTAEIRLIDAPEGTTPVLLPVPVPEHVARYHAVVRQVRNDKSRLEVSDTVLPRASRILQGLVLEAERRGCKVAAPMGHKSRNSSKLEWGSTIDGQLVITVGDYAQGLRIHEQGLRINSVYKRPPWDSSDPLDYRRSGTWRQVRDDSNATGQLIVDLVPDRHGNGRTSSWADRKRWTLEDKLPEILAEIFVRAAEAQHAQAEAERRAAARKVAWEAAMVAAEDRLHEARCAAALADQLSRWEQATRIRSYCDDLESGNPEHPETATWIAWARSHADTLDPASGSPAAPSRLAKPKPEDLRPYLDGLSPYGPVAGY